MKWASKMNPTDAAYVSLLLVFVALGTFVYALAVGSQAAWAIGGILVALMVVTVVGFRVGVRNRAASNDSGIAVEGADVWSVPLRREQIDRYLATYRGVQRSADPPRTVDVVDLPESVCEQRAA